MRDAASCSPLSLPFLPSTLMSCIYSLPPLPIHGYIPQPCVCTVLYCMEHNSVPSILSSLSFSNSFSLPFFPRPSYTRISVRSIGPSQHWYFCDCAILCDRIRVSTTCSVLIRIYNVIIFVILIIKDHITTILKYHDILFLYQIMEFSIFVC